MVGPGPAVHAGDARASRASARCSSAAASSSRSITGYSGDTFPNFTPNPWFQRAYSSRRGRGRALVVPRVRAAARSRRPRVCPRSRPARSPDRRWRTNDGFADGRHRRSVRSVCSRRSRPTSRSCTRRSPTAHGNVAVAAAAARRGLGCARRATRGAIVTVERIVDDLARHARPRAHPRAPGARGLRGADGRAPRRAVRPGPPGRRATARTTTSGSTRAPRREATTTTTGSATGSSSRRPGRVPRAARRRSGRGAAGEGRPESCTRRRTAAVPPDLDAPAERAGRPRRRSAARHLADRIAALDADAVLAGAGVANLAAWLGVRQARARGRATSQLTAEIGLWGYEPTLGDPFVLNHRQLPDRPRCSATRRWCSARSSVAPGTTHDRLPRRRADRPRTATSTRR